MKKRGHHKVYRKVYHKGYYKDEEILKFIIILCIFLIAVFVIYYFFLYTKTCQDQDCFTNSLVKCRRARWINDAEEATWLYVIKGRAEGKCEVEVNSLIIKKGELEMGKVEGKSMVCYTPLGIVESPEQNLASCTGPLKEDLQDLIIKRMHSYILENLGEISEEITKPI